MRSMSHSSTFLLCAVLCLVVPALAQTVEDPCTTFKTLQGEINGTFVPEVCWRITPFVSASRRPIDIQISFPQFNLGENTLEIYTGDSPVGSELYASFYGDTAIDFAIIDSAALFLYLKGTSECSFTFQYQAGQKTELKTAIICIRIAMCTQTKKIKQKQLQQPQFGTRRRLVALWAGLALGLLFMVLLLSRQIAL